MTTLTPHQARQLVAAINPRSPFGERNMAIIIFLFHTGLRVGELVALNHDHVYANGQTREVLHLPASMTKYRRSRVVPLNARARKAIEHLVAFNRARGFSTDAGAPLWVNRKHKRLSKRAVQYLLQDLREKAALDVKATPHSLRHAFATATASKTGDIRAVQQILGHRRLNTTAIYTHPDLAAMTRVASAIA